MGLKNPYSPKRLNIFVCACVDKRPFEMARFMLRFSALLLVPM